VLADNVLKWIRVAGVVAVLVGSYQGTPAGRPWWERLGAALPQAGGVAMMMAGGKAKA
jgi:hypothetical protein